MKQIKWSDIKAYLFFIFITIAMLMASSCAKDELHALRPGYLEAILFSEYQGISNNYSGKEIPSCSGVQPMHAVYSLQNEYGVHKDTFDIIVSDNKGVFQGQMEFPEGSYMVVDVSLYDSNWNKTHIVPDGSETVDFSAFVSKYVPYPIEILPYITIQTADDAVCFTYVEPIDPVDQGDISLVELESMHFYVFSTSCIEYVVLYVDGQQFASMEAPFNGLHTFAIPTEFGEFTLNGYVGGEVVQLFNSTDHQADNIYYFGLNCN